MTAIVPVPAAPTVPIYPALGSATFNADAYAYGSGMPSVVTGIQALVNNAWNNATAANERAVAADSSATTAAAAAASAVATAGATVWVSGTTYAIGDVRWSPVNLQSYRRSTAGAGTTDPSLDTTNWTRLGDTAGLGSPIASAATVVLNSSVGDFFHITGTTTITAITLASGVERTVVFDGALTLTHNATTLILPGGANITTAAGDRATFRGDGSGNTRCIHYTRASGQSLVATSVGHHEVTVHTGNGYGTTNTCVRRFTTVLVNTGSGITYADSAANAGSFTINETGLYEVYYQDGGSASNYIGVSVNSSALTTTLDGVPVANRVAMAWMPSASRVTSVARTMRFTAGDVIRAQAGNGSIDLTSNLVCFSIRKVGT